MKLWLLIVMILFGSPLFAQTRVLIDNRTDHEVDKARVRRLTAEALVQAPVNEPTIIIHIWPRKALRSVVDRKIDAFFVGPNHVYMHEMNYLALIHGLLLVTFPNLEIEEVGRRGRRIWFTEQLVVDVRTMADLTASQ